MRPHQRNLISPAQAPARHSPLFPFPAHFAKFHLPPPLPRTPRCPRPGSRSASPACPGRSPASFPSRKEASGTSTGPVRSLPAGIQHSVRCGLRRLLQTSRRDSRRPSERNRNGGLGLDEGDSHDPTPVPVQRLPDRAPIAAPRARLWRMRNVRDEPGRPRQARGVDPRKKIAKRAPRRCRHPLSCAAVSSPGCAPGEIHPTIGERWPRMPTVTSPAFRLPARRGRLAATPGTRLGRPRCSARPACRLRAPGPFEALKRRRGRTMGLWSPGVVHAVGRG